MVEFTRIEAKVRYRTLYVCEACGRQNEGATVTMEMIALDPDSVSLALKRQPQTSHYMPVGWNYSGKYNCGCAKKTGSTE